MREHIVSKRQNIHIAGSFSISKKSAFDTIRSGKKSQLCRCNSLSPVIMRVNGKYNIFSFQKMIRHKLNLIRKNIGTVHLHGTRKIDDYFTILRSSPSGNHGIADL